MKKLEVWIPVLLILSLSQDALAQSLRDKRTDDGDSRIDMKIVRDTLRMGGGTGAGNGGGGDDEQEFAEMRRQVGEFLEESSASSADILAWCSRVSGMLADAQRRSRIHNQKIDGMLPAIETLQRALIVANESLDFDPHKGGALTRALVHRGLQLAMALASKLDPRNNRTLITRLGFLDEYISFIINTERDLDRPFYVRYRYDGVRPEPDSIANQQWKFVSYAKEQLRFANEKLTFSVMEEGQLRYRTKGKEAGYLKVAELIALYVSFDLSNNYWASMFRTEVGDLHDHSIRLYKFNEENDRGHFPDVDWAVDETRILFDKVVSALPAFPGNGGDGDGKRPKEDRKYPSDGKHSSDGKYPSDRKRQTN